MLLSHLLKRPSGGYHYSVINESSHAWVLTSCWHAMINMTYKEIHYFYIEYQHGWTAIELPVPYLCTNSNPVVFLKYHVYHWIQNVLSILVLVSAWRNNLWLPRRWWFLNKDYTVHLTLLAINSDASPFITMHSKKESAHWAVYVMAQISHGFWLLWVILITWPWISLICTEMCVYK